jgi:CDP-glycerol glycerophosphotransferase
VTLLSIVLPAYRVQGYLEECLDSILRQPFTDIEVIGVDDCSPDHTGEVLDEYAKRDARVKVLHLEQNVGLGEARNAGLRQATGEYVWFIDSDDWLADGALWSVANRLRTTQPDVLAVDYAKAPWNAAPQPSKLTAALAQDPVPDVFALRDHPHILKIFHVAWNKIFRRQFLIDNEIQFPTGLYEDVPVGHAVLILAERISILPEVCVYYRQRRRGAITGTVGRRHFEVFTQWDRLFAYLDGLGERAAQFRPQVFERMLFQMLLALDNPERVSRGMRREFFGKIVEAYRRYLPREGYPVPEGKLGRWHAAVASGSFRRYQMTHLRDRVRDGLANRGAALFSLAWRTAAQARRQVFRFYYRLQLRRPLDENLAVYSMYWGRGYGCNPAPIYEHARDLAPQVRGVWEITRDRVKEIPKGVDYVVMGTLRHYRLLARAKYFVNNVNFPGWVVKRRGAVHLSTNHGTPIKVMGVDQLKYPVGARSMNMSLLLERCDRWTFSISPNAFTTRVWERAYPCDYESIESGYPRNDWLANATGEEVAAIRAKLGLRPDQRVILYAPTHREYAGGYQQMLNTTQLVTALGPDTVLLVRAHHFYENAGGSVHPQVIDVSDYARVEELYLAADALITDYSSAMFDYAVLDRPIVVYVPDFEIYRATRGLYIDVVAEAPGAVAQTQDELAEAFLSGEAWGEAAAKARQEFRSRYCYLDDGKASERVIRRVFLGEKSPIS